MKKYVIGFALIGCIALSSCSTVNYMSTDKLKANYEKKSITLHFLVKLYSRLIRRKKTPMKM